VQYNLDYIVYIILKVSNYTNTCW